MVTTCIAITGAHHTGKTLLARRIEMELRAVGLTVARVNGIARRAVAIGFPKMTRHTAASTEWIMTASVAARLEAELTADVVICEHSPADALAYWLAALDHRGDRPEPDSLRRLTTLAGALIPGDSVVLATTVDPSHPVGEHVGKDPDYSDENYRLLVDEHLHRLLAEYSIDHYLVCAGDEAEAIEYAINAATETLVA